MEIENNVGRAPENVRSCNSKKNSSSSTSLKNFQDLVCTKLSNIAQIPQDTKPVWVDDQFGWDPKNPRNPCMKEVVDALMREAGHKDINNLHEREKFYHDASELLYGALGSKDDSRDWDKILSAGNIISTARYETKKMHGSELDIITTKKREKHFFLIGIGIEVGMT